MDITKRYSILRLRQGFAPEQFDDDVITEYVLHVLLDGQPYLQLHCVPAALSELVIGRLLCDGKISCMEDIASITLHEKDSTIAVTLAQHRKAAPPAVLPEGPTFSYSCVMREIQSFLQSSELFQKTGSVHACAVCDGEQTLQFQEDIGKLNAFEKAVGAALKHEIDLSKTFVIVSGRVPAEMVTKAVRARIPMLISRSAPTDGAVEQARAANLTLCGFARGTRMNVYAAKERIL